MDTLTITQPDDWHIHLRDGELLSRTVPDASRQFSRAIIMPNLVPPVVNTEHAYAYRKRIIQHIPEGNPFNPLMTLYLTDNTTKNDIIEASNSGFVRAVKLYPAGATTNSDSGVTDILKKGDVFEQMQKQGMPLLIHGEVTDNEIDIFDREAVFIEQTLAPLLKKYPDLKVVLEHITTKDSVDFVKESSSNLAATITAHHLLFNRNHMLAGGIRPHYYCLPILKRDLHQKALIEAATSGNKKFFLGTDSAPHATLSKESSCGCAGCYTAYAAIELYATAFEAANALDKLEAFAAFYGADFYGLPRNDNKIHLKKRDWQMPKTLNFGDSSLTPLLAGETITWQRANG
ncbi:MAG: dihydroorotase [Cellvibrionales bacterium]|nr:dihydroorotase [Cellvibrionales bacterium]